MVRTPCSESKSTVGIPGIAGAIATANINPIATFMGKEIDLFPKNGAILINANILVNGINKPVTHAWSKSVLISIMSNDLACPPYPINTEKLLSIWRM